MDLRVDRYPKLRVTIRPDDRLRALVEKAPQAEVVAQKAFHWFRPVLRWFYSTRRRLGTGAVCLLAIWLFMHVMFGANGMVIYRQKRAEYHGLQKEIEGLQQESDRFNREIDGLKTDPATIEKEAREQLHYVRPGEVVYVAPAAALAQPAEVHSARK